MWEGCCASSRRIFSSASSASSSRDRRVLGGAAVADVAISAADSATTVQGSRPVELDPGERDRAHLLDRRRGRAAARRAGLRAPGPARPGPWTRSSVHRRTGRCADPRSRSRIRSHSSTSPSISAAIAMPARTWTASSYGVQPEQQRPGELGVPPRRPVVPRVHREQRQTGVQRGQLPGVGALVDQVQRPAAHSSVAAAISPSFSASTAAHCRPITATAGSGSSAMASVRAIRSISSVGLDEHGVRRPGPRLGGPTQARHGRGERVHRPVLQDPEVAEQDAQRHLRRLHELGRRHPLLQHPLGHLGQGEHPGVVARDRPQHPERGQERHRGLRLVVDQGPTQHVGQVVLLDADLVDRRRPGPGRRAADRAGRPAPTAQATCAARAAAVSPDSARRSVANSRTVSSIR